MTSLDTFLRESLHRLAQPGDPSGVVQSILARVDPPQTGDGSPPSPGSPASPAGPSILHSWVLWAGIVAASAVGGTALGASGAFGSGTNSTPGVPASIHNGALAFGCPGGAPVETLEAGTRILAILRSDDGAFLAIRDPYELSRTVWLPTGVVIIDDGESGTDTLPIGGCPDASVAPPSTAPTVITPKPSASPEPSAAPEPPPVVKPTKPAPPPPPPPPPPPDTTPPVISAGSFSPSPLHGADWGAYCPNSSALITVTATDDRGVSTVTGSTAYPGATVSLQSHSGSNWVFRFQMPNGNPAVTSASVSFTGSDTSGNTATASANIALEYCLY